MFKWVIRPLKRPDLPVIRIDQQGAEFAFQLVDQRVGEIQVETFHVSEGDALLQVKSAIQRFDTQDHLVEYEVFTWPFSTEPVPTYRRLPGGQSVLQEIEETDVMRLWRHKDLHRTVHPEVAQARSSRDQEKT